MRLERYREMRDFSRTPEPRGREVLPKKRHLAFYIQRHVARRLHYDFRLELGGVLKSWAVPKGPSLDPREKRLAVQTEDHPLEYGEFEGVIPEKQYGAGEVLLWDRGLWIPEDRDPEAALRKGRLHFRLEGEKLHGSWALTRMRDKQWLLIKRRDEDARSGDEAEITLKAPQSVKRPPPPAARATKSELPRFIAPQLATLVSAPPKGGNWIYEVKHDGYRLLARLSGGEVRLFTRSGKDWTEKLPHLVQALKEWKLDDTWLDGEIVVLREDGRSSFQALQNAFEAGKDAQIVYFVFDAPFLNGLDLRRLPLSERRKRLKQALERNRSPAIRYSEDLPGEAKEVLERACKLGLEGLMGKQADSVYVSGRTKSWIKLKCRRRQDFVIIGYTAPGGSRHGFGALLVGFHDAAGKLHYAGKVGTGFDESLLRSLTPRLASLKRSDPPPLENPPREKGVTWVRPVLVAEVEFTERTADGVLRQASFVGLREDIPAKSVGDEKPPHEVHIDKPIAVGRYEITFDEWEGCVKDGGCVKNKTPNDEGWGRARHPVINISWNDAREYVDWLSRKTGKTYRLLSEAEWEYAARAGTTSKYAFGDTLNAKQAKFSGGKQGIGETVEVGSFPPNNWGLYDMHGNVWEWVEDCYAPDYAGAPTDGSARVGPGCGAHALRGGSWDYAPADLRSAVRYHLPAIYRVDEIGFRVAREL